MAGVELITGGWFASAIIGKVVDLGRSYLGDNYDLHSGTRKMLTNLESHLPRIQTVIEEAEKQQISSRGLATWLEQLKDAAYEAEDVLDDFEAKRIRDSIKGSKGNVRMVRNLILSDNDLKKLKSIVNKLDKLCMGDLINTLQLNQSGKRKEHLDKHGCETSSYLDPGVAIFGRDGEIELILDMILNVLYGDFYHQALDDPNNLQQGENDPNLQQGEDDPNNIQQGEVDPNLQQGEDDPNLQQGEDDPNLKQGEGEGSSTILGLNVVPKAVKSLLDSSKSWKSKFFETVKKDDEPEQRTFRSSPLEDLVDPTVEVAHSDEVEDQESVNLVELRRMRTPNRTNTPITRSTYTPSISSTHITGIRPTPGSMYTPTTLSTSIIRRTYTPIPSSTYTPITRRPPITESVYPPIPGSTYTPIAQSMYTPITSSTHSRRSTPITSSTHTTQSTPITSSTHSTRSTPITWSTYTPITSSTHTTQSTRITRSLPITTVEEPHYISNHKLAVIPIVGVGGVGKTVVAKTIYNNERVKEHFDLRAWVYVSENCDAKKIMQQILCSFNDRIIEPWKMNLENVGNKLITIITNQRFLLILDDLRDRTELKWSDLRSVLCYGEVGSVVVATTQSSSIANTIRTLPEVTLDVLQPESFWDLFQYYAFGHFKLGDLNNEPPLVPSKQKELKSIGKEIAKKLHGLPLAGKVIGTLLSNKLEREFWDDIRGSDWWNIKDARENILPSIGVGYNYLDPQLKQCFVFCSIFPKHYVFERDRLVQMWIAHGYIQPGKEETSRLEKGDIRLEDIGRKWFGELVDRSFFQPTLSDGKYVMHDLVRDMAKAVSSNEFCFVKSHDNNLPSLARHVGIDCDNSKVEWKCKDSTRLRTVILFGNWTNCSAKSISNIFAKYNDLRVLDLSYIGLETNEPINAACQLSHLRFVDLSFTDTKLIPVKFCGLCHLQVLDLRGNYFTNLPEGINQLIYLRHLYASVHTIAQISSIGKLTKLQELEEFRIEKSKGHRISELMEMNEISGHLLLRNLSNVSSKEEVAKAQLDKKKYLKSLELTFQPYYHYSAPKTKVNVKVVEALIPPRSLEILKVGDCIWESFPGWVFSPYRDFCNLKVIHLYNFWLSCLPAFGELASLELLSFVDLPLIEKVGSEFYGSSEVVFPSLKELTFSKMSSWREWSDAEAGKTIFPHLKKLHMEECGVLKELPTDCFTSSVVELKLSECPDICNIETVLQRMPSLSNLSIKAKVCNSLTIDCTPSNSLEVLHLECTNHIVMKQLRVAGGLKSLVNLRKLVIKGFEILGGYEVLKDNNEISQEENEEQCLQFLTYLHLRHSRQRTQSLLTVGRLSSLRTLLIEFSFAKEYTRDEEIWFNQLTCLEKLELNDCHNLRCLPSQLHLHTSLKKLHLDYCPEMRSLPEKGLPQNLVELCIYRCKHLIPRCRPKQGDDWHKISHIPIVHLKE